MVTPHFGRIDQRYGEDYNKLAGRKEWMEIEGGHFGSAVLPGEEFERASSAQARFLTDPLLA